MVGAPLWPFYHDQFVATETPLISACSSWSAGLVVVGMLAGTLVMLADRVLGVVVICVGGEGEGVLAASLQGLPSPGPDGSPGRQDECLENSGQHRALPLI